MKRRGQSRKKIAVSTAAIVAAASYSYAQQSETPGFDLTFDVGTGVSLTRNKALADPAQGTTTTSDTALSFGLVSETRTQRLSFLAGTNLSFQKDPGGASDFDFSSPTVRLAYSREGANSLLEVNGSYNRQNLDDLVLTFLDEDLTPVDLVVDAGRLARTITSARFVTGIDGPLTFDVRVRQDQRNYEDTLDPDLYDRTTLSVVTKTSLKFSDVMTGDVTASWEQLDTEDVFDSDRTTTQVGFGVTYAISSSMTATAGINYNEITEDSILGTSTTEGFGWNLGLIRELANGTVAGSVSHRITEASERTQLDLDRSMDLPRGELSYGIGYSFSDNGEDRLIARMAYSQEFPTGRLRASLSQETAADDDSNDVLLTRANVGYSRDINALSSVGVDFGLGRSENVGVGGGDTTTRADLGVTYQRALTSEWDWSLGYRARYKEQTGAGSAMSNEVFTRIDRSFSIRP